MVFNPTMNYLGNGRVFGLTIPIIIAIVVCIIGFIILNYSEFGRYVYSIGGNEEATRLSGINVTFYKTIVYVMTGVCSALVGVLYVATLGASEPTVGNGLELDAIAVTAIGGTSLAGGRGGLIGTILGAILIGTIKNGLTLLNIVSYYQQVIIGAVIIVAVLLEYFRKNN
jgi:ribose/xylose/arabinose/galactoside ABC-type transport system permease subunit